jgi:hypothetical protein
MPKTEQQVAKKGRLIPVPLIERQPADRHRQVMHEVDQKRRLPVACRGMYDCETVVKVAVQDIEQPLPANHVRPTPRHQNLSDKLADVCCHHESRSNRRQRLQSARNCSMMLAPQGHVGAAQLKPTETTG